MSSLIRNIAPQFTYLARRGNTLLRTPIIARLKPDQKKLYQCGNPATVDAGGFQRSGWIGQGTDAETVTNVGFRLLEYAVNGTPAWIDASGPHDPEFVWYQGAYSTSQRYIETGKYMSEAFMQIPGYHFTVPNNMIGKYNTVRLKFQKLGACWAYGSSRARNLINKNIRNADYGWNVTQYGTFPLRFAFLNTPTCNYHQRYILETFPYYQIDIGDVGGQGDFRGSRDIWEISDEVTTDGHIPTLTNPVYGTKILDGTILEQFNNNNGGWFVPMSAIRLTTQTDYAPFSGSGGNGLNNYWASAAIRDVTIELTIE